MMTYLKGLFGSRKFVLTMMTMLTVLLNDALGLSLDPETITNMLIGNGIYVAGQGAVDVALAAKGQYGTKKK
jgi:cyanophycinase-like exopeptidase